MTNPTAPAPDPSRFDILTVKQFKNAYVLIVRYPDATNFEGLKCMVYQGKFPGVANIERLDPHFDRSDDSPIARFKPDKQGKSLAYKFARGLD